VLFSVNDLGVKVERLINGLDLGRTVPKNVLLEVEGIVLLEEGVRCSSLEEIKDTVHLEKDVGCSSLEERMFIVGAAASAKSL
jgi:hypothetical protein